MSIGMPAFAADIGAQAPAASWTGFYLGANAGYGMLNDPGGTLCYQDGVENGSTCQIVAPPPNISGAGLIGGAQAGYNWQLGPGVVAGVETDFQGAAIQGSTTIDGPFTTFGGNLEEGPDLARFTASERLNWLGTVRARLGVTSNGTMIYATGGLAYGNADLATDFSAPEFDFAASGNTTRAGYTVGGGIEWAFADRWSAKLEGLYYNLGTPVLLADQTSGSQLAGTFQRGKNFDLQGEILRVGLNYHF